MSTVAHRGQPNRTTERQKADQLRKAGQFEDAARGYADLWPDGDPWTGWAYAHCLRKLGRTAEALDVARELYRQDSRFGPGRSVYAWAIYDGYVRGKTDPDPGLLKAADAIVDLTSSEKDPYAATSPLVRTVFTVAKAHSTHGRHSLSLDWLDKLDPGRLPIAARSATDETGRKRELASPREQYYSLRTRALEHLARWQECLAVAEEAATGCGPLHHDNEIWFARRAALAKLHLGRAEESLLALQQLLARKPTCFLHTDIATAAAAARKPDLVFAHSVQALLTAKDIGYVLEAAKLLAEGLWDRGELDHARAHLRLSMTVRASRGWSVSKELEALAASWALAPGTADESLVDLSPFRKLWRRWSENLVPRQAGKILRILPHGRSGFIRAADGADLYFSMHEWRDRMAEPAESQAVTFATRQGFDKKRNRSTTVAYDVRSATPDR